MNKRETMQRNINFKEMKFKNDQKNSILVPNKPNSFKKEPTTIMIKFYYLAPTFYPRRGTGMISSHEKTGIISEIGICMI